MSKESLIEFLEKCLGAKVVDCDMKSLTKPGENYGSNIEKVTLTILKDGKKEKLDLVAKKPVTNEFLKSCFQPELTCIKENCFYSKIIPALEQLQNDYNIPKSEQLDIFIKHYGSRLSLHENSEEVDDNAVLVLENVKLHGFDNGDRFAGFDAKTTKLVLKEFAKFHAIPIALRLLRPNVFEQKVRPYLNRIIMNKDSEAEMAEYVQSHITNLDKVKELSSDYRARLYEQLLISEKHRVSDTKQADTPFTTISHNDTWMNNFMILKDSKGDVTKIKIYDFQLTSYNTFASDLLFFLFTTVNTNVLKTDFQKLVRVYYDQFYNVLKQFGCDLSHYTYDLFYREIKDNAKWEALHIIAMIFVVTADPDHTPDISEMDIKFFLEHKNYNEAYFDKLRDVTLQFEELGFI